MSGIIPENNTPTEEAQQQQQPTQPAATGPGLAPPQDASAWLQEIAAAKEYTRKFHITGDKIMDRYLDKRTDATEGTNKYNLFTVNTQILISTLYAKFPKPLVTREWEDQVDDTARVAATILERCLIIRDRDDFHAAMKHATIDRMVPGLGQVWFRYDPTIVSEEVQPQPGPDGQPPVDPATGQPQGPQMMDRLVNEEVVTDYVNWKDFLWSPCRVWEECRWVARAVKMNKMDVAKRFGDAIANSLKYKKGTVGDSGELNTGSDDNKDQIVHYATIYEIWCKRTRNIYWVAEGYATTLDIKKDPFQLPGFWPCPKPWFGLLATSSTIPRADYLMIQDQYQELDSINNRITYLERAVKVVGVYDQTQKELGRILLEDKDNVMIPAANFAQFAEKGGFSGTVAWMPLADIVAAIERLRQYRQDLIQQIYELSGISDIMRGATKASETLGAQELKAQYGGVRLQFMQMDCAEFVEEALDIKARIMVKMFQPETLLMRSNIQQTVDAELAQPAVQLLRDQLAFFRVKVHADSMAVPEFNAERDARMQYLRMVSEFMTGMAPLVQQQPGAAPFLLEMLQWGAAGFRVGRTIEGTLDRAVEAAKKALATPPAPKPPDPKDVAVAKRDSSQALLNVAKAEGQTLENKAMQQHPDRVLPEPKTDSPPTTH